MSVHPAQIATIKGEVTYADGRSSTYRLTKVANKWTWSEEGMANHELCERLFGDVLDEMAMAVDTHQRENVPDTHWHVGANVSGYLPESDVVCVFDADDARDVLIEDLRRVFENMPFCDERELLVDKPCSSARCGGCGAYRAVQKVLDNPDQIRPEDNDGYGLSVNDGRALPVQYWIVPVPREECEIGNDEKHPH